MITLGEITKIRAGHAFRSRLDDEPSALSLVLQMKDIDESKGVDWSTVVRCPPVAIKKEWLTANDILLVARGARNHAYYLRDEPPYPTLAAPHFYHISLKSTVESTISPEFIAWQLNQQPAQEYFKRNAEGSTSKSIRRAIVEETPIILPPKLQQETIVKLQQLINKERSLAETLVENGQKIMQKIWDDFTKQSDIPAERDING